MNGLLFEENSDFSPNVRVKKRKKTLSALFVERGIAKDERSAVILLLSLAALMFTASVFIFFGDVQLIIMDAHPRKISHIFLPFQCFIFY